MAIPAAAMVGIMAVSAAIGTVGTVVSAIQQSSTAKQNQQIANNQAAIAQEQSRVQQDEIRRRGALAIGQQGAAAGASGVDTGSGTLLDVQNDTENQVQYDLLKTRYNGNLQAWSYRAQAAQYGKSASNAMIAGGINTASSLLDGGYKTWNAGYQAGLWAPTLS